MMDEASPASGGDRRRAPRFSDLTLLYLPIYFYADPPLLDRPVVGNLINLSQSGCALEIGASLPVGARVGFKFTFPDRSVLEGAAEIARLQVKGEVFVVGMRFVAMPDFMAEKIDRMAVDYNACEERIRAGDREVCRLDCRFFVICRKQAKRETEVRFEEQLWLSIKTRGDED